MVKTTILIREELESIFVSVPKQELNFHRQMLWSLVVSDLRWEVIVHFVDSEGTVDHRVHYLNFFHDNLINLQTYSFIDKEIQIYFIPNKKVILLFW